jgi:hypothetical protein
MPTTDYDLQYIVTYEDGRQDTLLGTDTLPVINLSWETPRIIPIAELKEYLAMKSLSKRLYIELPEPASGEETSLVVHPYLLGVLIGDGSLTSDTLTITSADPEILEKCSPLLPEGMRISTRARSISYGVLQGTSSTNILLKYIRDNNLNTTSYYKHVPEEYLTSSYSQRVDLIKGLMDTDGTIDPRGHSSFCTTSPQLAKDMQRLIHSVGGLAKITNKVSHFTYKGEYKTGAPAYIINIRVKNPKMLFGLQRKLDRAPSKNQYSDYLKLRIKSVAHYG